MSDWNNCLNIFFKYIWYCKYILKNEDSIIMDHLKRVLFKKYIAWMNFSKYWKACMHLMYIYHNINDQELKIILNSAIQSNNKNLKAVLTIKNLCSCDNWKKILYMEKKDSFLDNIYQYQSKLFNELTKFYDYSE